MVIASRSLSLVASCSLAVTSIIGLQNVRSKLHVVPEIAILALWRKFHLPLHTPLKFLFYKEMIRGFGIQLARTHKSKIGVQGGGEGGRKKKFLSVILTNKMFIKLLIKKGWSGSCWHISKIYPQVGTTGTSLLKVSISSNWIFERYSPDGCILNFLS